MYSEDRVEKSTGASTQRLLRPWRTFILVRVSRRSSLCTCRSLTRFWLLSNSAKAREMPSSLAGLPGSNRAPP
ncbi:hypothetical protein D9M70_630010 [compost metagenome]